MKEMVDRLDDVARGSALSLQGEVEIETQMGYLPFVQDRYISSFAAEVFQDFDEISVMRDENPISAAGDIGDLSFMMPCMQIGYSGFAGTIHGDDFIEDDPEYIYEVFPRFLYKVLEEMSGNIDKSKLYRSTYDDYKEYIDSIME